jgi:hypothetical protein
MGPGRSCCELVPNIVWDVPNCYRYSHAVILAALQLL